MQLYEMVFVLRPTVDEKAIGDIKEEIKSFIGQNKGELKNFIDIGNKKLSYEIEKEKEGHFIRAFFNIDSVHLEELLRQVKTRDNVVRTMITKKIFVLPDDKNDEKERRKSNVAPK